MNGPFRVIAADCPWQFDDALPDTKGAGYHYDCMTTNQICHLADYGGRMIMGEFIANDAVLFLWRVASQQQAALDVARAWGFVVKTDLVWLKKTTNGLRWFGMGHTLRAEHETCLVCTRGRPEVLNHSVRSTFVTELDLAGLSAVNTRHSAKPDEFYQIVESLVAGPYLELFGRKQRPGWTVIGNEVEGSKV